MPTLASHFNWEGHPVVDSEGEPLGKVEQLYLDPRRLLPEWALVKAGLLDGSPAYVPLRDAEVDGDEIRVKVNQAAVWAAPQLDRSDRLTGDDEARLREHYGIEAVESPASDGEGEGGSEAVPVPVRQISGTDPSEAMIRSEEQLELSKRRREGERVRLVKYIVTEEVIRTIPLRREEVRLERVAIEGDSAAAANSSQGGDQYPWQDVDVTELTLLEEQVVIEKRVVPRERVRLRKETVEEERTITEDVRHEEIEAQGDVIA